ncbi:MAG: hypothetical protein ACFFAK_08195 [Promethearchaeota archaeon]
MIIIAEVRGRYILMIDRLLNEFNPEIAEVARKELDTETNNMTEEGWYDFKNLQKYLSKVSEPAQRVLGKKVINAKGQDFAQILEMFEKPVELLKFAVKNDPKEDFRKEDWHKTQILDSGDDFITIKLDSDGFPAYYEGIYMGILEMYKIIKTHIKTTTEHVNGLELSTLEIKWQ